MSLEIRRATLADGDALAALFQQYLTFYGQQFDSQQAAAYVPERLRAGDSVVFVAEVDGEAVGFAQCYPSWSSLRMTPYWQLNDLFVTEAARGTGAGRTLVQEVCAAAARDGAVSVDLETHHDNTRAQGLYEAEGFALATEYRQYSKPV